MTTPIQLLLKQWDEVGIPRNDPVTPEELDGFEARIELELPEDFREYLLAVSGMQSGAADEHLVSFLPLQEIEAEITALNRATDMPFAEFSIFAHYYALRFGPDNALIGVYAADGTNEVRLADSFSDLVMRYLRTPSQIAHCW